MNVIYWQLRDDAFEFWYFCFPAFDVTADNFSNLAHTFLSLLQFIAIDEIFFIVACLTTDQGRSDLVLCRHYVVITFF